MSAVLGEYHPNLQLHTTLPQKEKKEQLILEPEQIAVLLRAVDGTEMEIPVLLAVWLCMRASEIMGLTWDCIDFEHGVITVKKALVRGKDNTWVEKTTKTTSSTRTIRAPDYIMDRLKAAKEQAATEHVVTIRGGGLYKRLKTILRRNDLPDIRFHDLRAHGGVGHAAAQHPGSVCAASRRVGKQLYDERDLSTPDGFQA